MKNDSAIYFNDKQMTQRPAYLRLRGNLENVSPGYAEKPNSELKMNDFRQPT